jgi:two-component system, OmpR family, phosphate regulon response regulator OmpR
MIKQTKPHVLIVDDDQQIRTMLARFLGEHGMRVTQASDGVNMFKTMETGRFDVIVLDVMMPGEDGFTLCRKLRAESAIPLILLTARNSETDRIVGLELGADDYLGKPFEPRELLARVKALLRRAQPVSGPDDVLAFGRLEIDLGAREARLDGKRCDLTSHQFELLAVLAQSAGRVLTRDQIMDALRGHPMEAFDRSIDVHVSRIRAAIEDDPKTPKRVLTVRGAGYIFAKRQDADSDE